MARNIISGPERARLPVSQSGTESGNVNLSFDPPAREIFIINDSSTVNLTLSINGMSFTIMPGEIIDERFVEFTSAIVTTTGAWRWYVRSGWEE